MTISKDFKIFISVLASKIQYGLKSNLGLSCKRYIITEFPEKWTNPLTDYRSTLHYKTNYIKVYWRTASISSPSPARLWTDWLSLAVLHWITEQCTLSDSDLFWCQAVSIAAIVFNCNFMQRVLSDHHRQL